MNQLIDLNCLVGKTIKEIRQSEEIPAFDNQRIVSIMLNDDETQITLYPAPISAINPNWDDKDNRPVKIEVTQSKEEFLRDTQEMELI